MKPGLACSEMPGSGQMAAPPHSATGKLENPSMRREQSVLSSTITVGGIMNNVIIVDLSSARKVGSKFYVDGRCSNTRYSNPLFMFTQNRMYYDGTSL